MPVQTPEPSQSAFRTVAYMGVIYVVAEAVKLGFENGHPDWCNLGQGQPEVGELEGAPERLSSVTIKPEDHAYGPLEGTPELRQAVAEHYNRLFRKNHKSKYTAANVSIAQGGRLALTRAMAALGDVRVGYQRPDYTAYEDMLQAHLSRVTPVPLLATAETGFAITPAQLEQAIDEEKLDSMLISNPCNPTGVSIRGPELERMIQAVRERGTTFLLDEFYSHFAFETSGEGAATPSSGPISGAAYIEDVNRDPVVIFDGLTKGYRYPGWRLGWVLGPPEMVENMARTASAIDGGPSRIVQRAALEVLKPSRADQETNALRKAFCAKRNLMVERLKAMGMRFAAEPDSTFYCWASIADLPAPFNDANTFFRRALERKVMTVPGEFFDVNPGGLRTEDSPFKQWMRFSFGPPMDNMKLGLDRLAEMLS